MALPGGLEAKPAAAPATFYVEFKAAPYNGSEEATHKWFVKIDDATGTAQEVERRVWKEVNLIMYPPLEHQVKCDYCSAGYDSDAGHRIVISVRSYKQLLRVPDELPLMDERWARQQRARWEKQREREREAAARIAELKEEQEAQLRKLDEEARAARAKFKALEAED